MKTRTRRVSYGLRIDFLRTEEFQFFRCIEESYRLDLRGGNAVIDLFLHPGFIRSVFQVSDLDRTDFAGADEVCVADIDFLQCFMKEST